MLSLYVYTTISMVTNAFRPSTKCQDKAESYQAFFRTFHSNQLSQPITEDVNSKVWKDSAQGVGQVVSVLAFYCNDTSSNTSEVYNFCCKKIAIKERK